MQGLPAGWYVDPGRGAREIASVFLPSWQFVCHDADLPAPGTAARFDCGGHSAFVLRTRSRALVAYRNVCSHRGARLIDGDPATGLAFVLEGRVRCPYHGWCYDEHGQLESIPPGQAFAAGAPGARALAAMPVVEWRGLVFVCLGTPERSLDDALGAAASDWPEAAAMRRLGEPRSAVVEADWKLACEHQLDTAHLRVARSSPSPRVFEPATFEVAGPDALLARVHDAEAGQVAWPARSYLKQLAQHEPARMLYLWPNLWLLAAPDALCVLQALPLGTGRSRWRLSRYGVPDASAELRRARYLHERAWRRILRDDARRLERVQHGLGNVAPDHAYEIDAAQAGLQWFVSRHRTACGEVESGTPPARPVARRSRKKTVAAPASVAP